MDMKCIFGVSGGDDATVRHTVGRRVVSTLARELDVDLQSNSTIGAQIAQAVVSNGELLLVIPDGLLDQNGAVFERVLQRYDLQPTDVLVVYDDVDMPFGEVDISDESADTKQPGVILVNQHGGADTWRLRVGTQSAIQGCLADDVFSGLAFSAEGIAALDEMVIPTALDKVHEFVAVIV